MHLRSWMFPEFDQEISKLPMEYLYKYAVQNLIYLVFVQFGLDDRRIVVRFLARTKIFLHFLEGPD
jgi:hypothetical protein